jgi:putative tricarboxylic transport membrane protein
MAVSILISFTFSWEVNEALALMAGVFLGGVYGGSRTAILLNIPGAPSALVTALDGYPLARRGKAGQAIGLSTIMSFIGGLLGISVLMVAAPIISNFTLAFAPRDYFLLAVLGLLLVGSLAADSFSKGVFCGALGVLLATVGLDPLTAEERFTFDALELMNGIPYVAAMIGFFGFAEILVQLEHLDVKQVRQELDKILPSLDKIKKHLPLSVRTSMIGVFVGALPGTGGDIASLLAYDHAKRSVKNPSADFGDGAEEGLIAAETANNAAVGGAYIPMLTLGIPGDAVTAVIIGALFIHGVQPGPLMLTETPHLFWFSAGTLMLANVFVLIFGLTGIGVLSKIVQCPKGILFPLIFVLCIVGTYAIQNSLFDVYWMMGCGLLGYFLKRYGFQVAPIVLGLILGPLMDVSFRRAALTVQSDASRLAWEFVSNPVTAVLTAAIVLVLLRSFIKLIQHRF